MSDGGCPGPSPSNEVPGSANGCPQDISIKQDSSFNPTTQESEKEGGSTPPLSQTSTEKKIAASAAPDHRIKKSGGGGAGPRPNTGRSTSTRHTSLQGDRAKMSTSGRPGPGDQSTGSPTRPSQKPASMNSAMSNKKSSTVIGATGGGRSKRDNLNSKAGETHKPDTSTNTSFTSTMQKKSTSGDKKTVKKTAEDRKPSLHESHKKSSSLIKDRGSASATSKKTSVTKPGPSKKSAAGTARKASQATDKSSETTGDPAKSKYTSEDPDNAEQKTKITPVKNGSLEKRSAPHKPIEKTDSSVSLVRKKFEKKYENNDQGTAEGGRKLTEPLPRGKISQNVFLKEDAQKRKPKAQTQQVSHMRTESDNFNPLINKDSESGLHSENDSLQMNSKDSHHGGPLFSCSADLAASPEPCERDLDLNCQNESINCIQNTPIIHSDDASAGQEGNLGNDDGDEENCSPLNSLPRPAGLVTYRSGSQPIPDLNIDDVPLNEAESCTQDPDGMDRSDRSSDELDISDKMPDRLGPGFDHELPESPAYRSPLLSDSESEEPTSSRQHVLESFAGSYEEPMLRNKLLSNLVNKRSESDGIVTLDRPKADKPVRRCESIDDGMDLVSRDMCPTVSFPKNIKTVTPATIMKGPEDYTAGLQETVYLRAHYFGNPEPRVAWYKGGRRLNHTERIKIRTYPGESTLVIRDLRADDSGKYEIQIENEVGNDATSASLCVEGPPEPPGGRPYITTIDKDKLRLTLAWYGSTFDGGSMLTGYIVEMSSWPITTDEELPEPTDWTILTSKCHSTSYIVRNLTDDSEYIFRVRAQNIHGPSMPGKVSEPVSFSKMDDDDLVDDGDDMDDSDEEFDSPFEHKQVSLEDGNIFKDKFEIYEELGRGRFGVVFKVKDMDTRELFAAKFVRCRKQEEREKCKEEISIMNGLDHSRLLQLAAAYENPREVIMIMEFIGGGELFEKVVADDFTLTEHDCVLFMRQICSAIGYMHQNYIVHLDLKPENILCKSKKSHQIKIIDFGLTRKLKPGEDVRILFGTPEFVSPEVISYEPVSASSDMWSVGVVCYVLLSGLSPFMGDSDVETFANITGMCYDFDDEAFDHISEDAKDFILKLLVKDQRKRLKALECLKHPWLTQKEAVKGDYKEINTDKLKSFLMRRRWQKAAHAIRALGRFTSLGFNKDAKDGASSITGFSTQSADF